MIRKIKGSGKLTLKVILLGGSGFVGQGVLDQLAFDPHFEILSISRSGGTPILKKRYPRCHWLKIDLQKQSVDWDQLLDQADWIVDLLGVLLAKDQKTYQKLTLIPLLPLVAAVKRSQQTKLLFVSAKTAPKALKNYLSVKRQTEQLLKRKLGSRAVILYPSLIYQQQRKSTWILAHLLLFGQRIPPVAKYFKKWQPISRERFCQEVKKILLGADSWLEQQNSDF